MQPAVTFGSILSILMTTVVTATAQSGLQAPLEPLAPTDIKQCSALAQAWQQVCRQVDQRHTQCLDNYEKKKVPRGKTCSKAPCEKLHGPCGLFGDRSLTEVDQCYAKVRDHDRLKQEERRRQEENFRRSQDSVRKRGKDILERDRRQHDSDLKQIEGTTEKIRGNRDRYSKESSRHLEKAREFERVAEDYSSRSRDGAPPTPDPQDALARLEALIASNPLGGIGEATTLPEREFIDVDTIDFLDSVGDFLRKDVIDYLDKGLSGREAHEPIRMYRQLEGAQASYEKFKQFAGFAREQITDGELGFQSSLDFLSESVKELGSFSLRNSPANYMFGRAVGAIKDTLSTSLSKFETSIRLFNEGATIEEFNRATDFHDIVENIFRKVVPFYDEARRIDNGVNKLTKLLGWE